MDRPYLRDGKWYVTRERFEAVRPDGTSANYSVGDPAGSLAARYISDGCAIVRHEDEREEPAYRQVILTAAQSADDPEGAALLMAADMQRALNMTRDAGRPSDAARSSARAFLSGSLTWESFNAARPTGNYPDDRI